MNSGLVLDSVNRSVREGGVEWEAAVELSLRRYGPKKFFDFGAQLRRRILDVLGGR